MAAGRGRTELKSGRSGPDETAPAAAGSRWLHPGVMMAALMLISAVFYLPHVGSPWLYDDLSIIAENPHIRNLGQVGQFLSPRYWNTEHMGTKGLYRPLREVTFTFIYALAGTRPAAYGAVSFAAHVAVVLLTYLLGLRLLKQPLGAALGGLLFAVHPVHVEAVLWRKNLGELLATVFALAGFWCLVRWRQAREGERSGARFYIGGAGLYILSLLSKETALALPFITLLYVAFNASPRVRRHMVVWTLALFLMGVAYVAFQVGALRLVGDTMAAPQKGPPRPEEALWLRPALVGKTVATYHRLLLWPVELSAKQRFEFPQGYGLAQPPRYTDLATAWYMLAFLVILALMAVAIGRWPRGAWLVMWVCAFLVTAANIMPFEGRPIGEQRLYLPSVGFCLWAGMAAAGLWERRDKRRIAAGLGVASVAVVLLLNAVLTAARAEVVRDWPTFWRDLLVTSPEQAETHNQWGNYYRNRGRPAQARAHATLALKFDPHYANSYVLMGIIEAQAGHLTKAIDCFRQAEALNPSLPMAPQNLATAYLQTGRFPEAALALKNYLALVPNDVTARLDLVTALANSGRPVDAARELQAVLANDVALDNTGALAGALTTAAVVMLRSGQRDLALAALRRAVVVTPGYPRAMRLLQQEQLP